MAKGMLAADGRAERRQVVIKPNVVIPRVRDDDTGQLVGGDQGVVTDPQFVAGIIDRLRELGVERIAVAEGGGPIPMGPVFEDRGYGDMARETDVTLVDLNRKVGEYTPEELNWIWVDGVVFRDIPFVRPVADADALFLNVPTMKTHNLGIISLAGKALQGTIATGFRHFCSPLARGGEKLPEVWEHYQPGVEAEIERLHARHLAEGYARWDQEGSLYEVYAQRTCDAITAMPGFVHIVEGVMGRDGTAFRQGKDVLANLSVAGANAVEVDAVTAYLMGHDPRNIGYLRVAAERGLGRIDPETIPVYLLQDDEIVRCQHPEEVGRVLLGCYFRGDSSNYVFF